MSSSNPFGTTGYSGSDEKTLAGVGEQAKEKLSEVTTQAKEKAAELGRNTADAIDRNLGTAAEKLQGTADSLRMKAGDGEGQIARAAGAAADGLDRTAQYFREHNTHDMVSGVEQLVRRNPGASLAAALGVGFLLGAALKRDKY